MRRLISFFAILVLFANCRNKSTKEENSLKESKSPKQVVEAYLAATNRFDATEAKEFLILNKDNEMLLETIKKMEKSIPDKEKSRFLNKEKNAIYSEKTITDSTARIIVNPDQGIAMPIEFNLKKINNNWLIESVIFLQ